MKASPMSLFDVVKPICWNLNLLGFNFGNEKPAGCVKKIYRLAVKCVMVFVICVTLINDCDNYLTYQTIDIFSLNSKMLLIVGCSMNFFFVKEIEIEGLMMSLKQLSLGKKAQKSLSKHLVPLKSYSTLFAILALSLLILMVIEMLDSSDKLIVLLMAIAVMVGQTVFLLTLQFPSLICILPCIVACYCRAEMDEAIEDMKKIESPLRRAKTSAKLIKKYHQLYELASDTDRALSTAMYFMKWPFVLTLATTVMTVNNIGLKNKITEYYMEYLGIILFLLTYFPLLQYFYMGPLANQMFNLLNGTIVESNSIDDQWLSRDPITRPYLLHMRMKQIEQLIQMATEEPPFTLFGEIVDHEVLYMIILELYDMWNTLSVHGDTEEMRLQDLLNGFFNRYVDCRSLNSWLWRNVL